MSKRDAITVARMESSVVLGSSGIGLPDSAKLQPGYGTDLIRSIRERSTIHIEQSLLLEVLAEVEDGRKPD